MEEKKINTEEVKEENNEEKKVETEIKEEKDTRTFGEKLEDKLDDVRAKTEDFFYGEKGDFTDDIPATMYDANGYRKVNKYQTRKNINKRIFAHKGFVKALLIILGLGIGITILYSIINALLLS